MPYCPNCRDQFEDWVKECPDCHVKLVGKLPGVEKAKEALGPFLER